MGHQTEGGWMPRIQAGETKDLSSLQEENEQLRGELKEANERIAFLQAMNDEFCAAARDAKDHPK